MIMDTRTSFGPGIPFLGQFGPEYQNCQFKLKFGTKTNCNMQNSVVMFILFIHPFWESLVQKIKVVSLNWKLASRLIRICRIQRWCLFFLFLTGKTLFCKFGPKNQYCQFKLKFGSKTNSNMQNWMVMLTFSVFDRKHPFWVNLVEKSKIVSLSWNLVSRLIQIWRNQWWCSLFLFLSRKHPFWTNLVQKMKIVSLSWNMIFRLIWICRIQWWCSLFLFQTRNILFYCLCDHMVVETLK